MWGRSRSLQVNTEEKLSRLFPRKKSITAWIEIHIDFQPTITIHKQKKNKKKEASVRANSLRGGWKKIITKSHKRAELSFCLGQSGSSGWGIEWDKSWWNRVLLPHRWSIVCQHQSARNGRTVHSSAHGLLKSVGCFWMPQAQSSFQRHYWIEPIYLPLYQLRMHFLIYTSIWFFTLWRIPWHTAPGRGLLSMRNSCNEYVSLTPSKYQQEVSAKQM